MHLVGFIIRKFVTMHGHVSVKCIYCYRPIIEEQHTLRMSADTFDTQYNVCKRKVYYILGLLYVLFLWSRIEWFQKFSFFMAGQPPIGPWAPHCWDFEITIRPTTLGRTPLDEWLAGRRDLYRTTHNTQKRQTSMLPGGFEPSIPASERPQARVLDRAATEMGSFMRIQK
jgi:hypothetical protein